MSVIIEFFQDLAWILTSKEARRFYAGAALLSGVVGAPIGGIGLLTYAMLGVDIGLAILAFGLMFTVISVWFQALVSYKTMMLSTAGTAAVWIALTVAGHPYLAAIAVLVLPVLTAYHAYENTPPVWGDFP